MKLSRKLLFLPICFLVLVFSGCRQLAKEERHELYTTGQRVAEPIITASEQYYADKGVYPEKLSLLVPQYLSEIPRSTTSSEFSYRIDELYGGYHLKFGVDANSACGYSPRFGWDCSFGD